MSAPPKFGIRTKAEEAAKGQDLSGKTAVITGGNSGLGESSSGDIHPSWLYSLWLRRDA